MTTTAVARVVDALERWGTTDIVPIARTDAEALIAIIAEHCDDHTKCTVCDTTLCTTCGLGEPARCSDRHSFEDHCADCSSSCRTCAREIAEDAKAERYAEAHGMRY